MNYQIKIEPDQEEQDKYCFILEQDGEVKDIGCGYKSPGDAIVAARMVARVREARASMTLKLDGQEVDIDIIAHLIKELEIGNAKPRPWIDEDTPDYHDIYEREIIDELADGTPLEEYLNTKELAQLIERARGENIL
jgi:hypothetical protein